jgi:hypothetical protein
VLYLRSDGDVLKGVLEITFSCKEKLSEKANILLHNSLYLLSGLLYSKPGNQKVTASYFPFRFYFFLLLKQRANKRSKFPLKLLTAPHFKKTFS